MQNQTLKYAGAAGLLFLGLVLGFQAGKAKGVEKVVMAESVRTAAITTVQPADYFPAQYVNKAEFAEPLPPQF